jgi:hypothetical protein
VIHVIADAERFLGEVLFQLPVELVEEPAFDEEIHGGGKNDDEEAQAKSEPNGQAKATVELRMRMFTSG